MTGGSTTTKGYVPNQPKRVLPPTASGEVEQFMVLREYANHIVCVRATCDFVTDSTGRYFAQGSEEVRIAKPPEMRPALFDYRSRGGLAIGNVDGLRYDFNAADVTKRTVTMTDASQYGAIELAWEEIIHPPYLLTQPAGGASSPALKIIFAMRVKQSPIARVAETVSGVTKNYDVEWEDLNVAARRFEPIYRKLRVCVEGQTGPWFVLIRASQSFQET